MAQFDVHVLVDGTTVVCLQSDAIDVYRTTLVAPLLPAGDFPKRIPRLHPTFRLGGEQLMLAPQLMAAIPSRLLGERRGSLIDQEYAIKAALDIVLTGF